MNIEKKNLFRKQEKINETETKNNHSIHKIQESIKRKEKYNTAENVLWGEIESKRANLKNR